MLLALPLILLAAGAAQDAPPRTATELFSETKVWSLHLTFTAKEWDAMEPPMPKGGGFGAMPTGPSGFVAPVFLKAGDRDGDGVLSVQEFRGLGEKWFSDWDKKGEGKLSAKPLRDGLNAAFGPPPGEDAGPPPMSLQGPKGKRNGLSAMMGTDFVYVHADLDFNGRTFKDVGVRYKGNGTFLESRGSLKRSLKIDFNKYVRKAEFAGSTTLNLHNNVTDASSMNEALAFRLYREAGLPAPRVTFAKVFVTVPGKHDRRYFGLYSIVENVDKRFAQDVAKDPGGAIFKPVSPSLFADLGDDWDAYEQTYDPKTELTLDQKRRLIAFCKLVSHASDAELAARLGDYLDLDELAGYMAVMTWLSDLDGLFGSGQNFYVIEDPRTRKYLFVPWDQDHSFGQFPVRGTQEEREQLSIRKPWDGKNRFLERLYKVDAFQARYLARMKEYSSTVFRPERFDAGVAEIAKAIRPAVEAESKDRLARFDKAVAGESLAFSFGPPPPPGEGKKAGGPPPGPFGGGPQWAIVPIRPFAKVRSKSVADQVAGKSPGKTLGSSAPPMAKLPSAFGLGGFLSGLFQREFDTDRDMTVSREEFSLGFAKWLAAWDSDKDGKVTDKELRAGIDKDLGFRGPGG